MAVITKRRKAFSVIYHVIDKDGNDKQVWETFYDYKEAVKRKNQIENTDNVMFEITKETKIIDFLNEYVSSQGLKIWSTSRYQTNVGIINNYLKRVLGNKKIKEINLKFAEILINDLKHLPAIGKRHQKKDQTIPSSMLCNCHTLLKNVFEYLIEIELIEENPFHTVIVPPLNKDKKNKSDWNMEYVKLMLDSCEDPRLFIALHLLFGCGLDLSELFALNWDDIHLSKNANFIVSNKIAKRLNLNTLQDLNKSIIIKQFKNESFTDTNTAFTLLYKERPRKIMIPAILVPLIKLWREKQTRMFGINPKPHEFVIDTEAGNPYGERTFSKLFFKVKKKMKHEELTLVKLKNYGVKMDIGGISNAVKFYTNNPQSMIFPDIKPKQHDKNGGQQIKNVEIKRKFDSFLPTDTSDLNVLIEQMKSNPELKMKLIHKLQEELI